MLLAKKLYTSCLALVLVATTSGAAFAAQMANGGGGGKKKAPMSSCIRIVDKDVGSSGTNNAQYFTALFTLKNVCRSGTYNVTFDVPFAGNPKCQRIAPGRPRNLYGGTAPTRRSLIAALRSASEHRRNAASQNLGIQCGFDDIGVSVVQPIGIEGEVNCRRVGRCIWLVRRPLTFGPAARRFRQTRASE